jgi:hypothetical protein
MMGRHIMDAEATANGEAAAEAGANAAGETGAEGLKDKIAEAMEAEGTAGEPAETGEPDGSEAGTSDDDAEAEDGKLQAGEVKGLSPEAQAKVNERIHKLNIKRKDAEARAAAAEAKAKELEGRDAASVQDAIRLGLAPEYVTKEEVAQIKRYETLRLEKRWLARHRDGYEGSGEKGDVSLSAEDVAERALDVDEELSDLAPQAKALLKERSEQMLADMKLGRSIRNKTAKGGSSVRKPTALPGRTTPKKPWQEARKERLGTDSFHDRGSNRSALETIYESRF